MKRNFLILLCLILFIVSIACVSATEDVNQTDNLELSLNSNFEDKVDLDNNNGLDESDDLNKKLESDSNILAMSKADKLTGREIVVENFTFGDIQNAVDSAKDGDTVYLKAGTYLNNGNGPINIDQNNIFIVGVKDSTILDAQKTSGIFNILAGSGITIKDIVFINGKASLGGAIHVFNAIDNFNIDATFINNTASNYGGANYFNNAVSNVNISGTYINNTADYGGANYFYGTVSNVNISGTYINNTAKYYGGANEFYRTVSDSYISGTYINNTAGFGGANYFLEAVSDSDFSGTYINNTASNYGGANYFLEAVSDSYISGTYINNTADFGGANYLFNAVSNVNSSGTYINNIAKYYGGANYFNNAVSDSYISGTYINNTADFGGANYFNNAVSNVNSSGTYINNTASNNGGANYFQDTVLDSDISGTYINNTASDGGANYFNNAVSNVNISGTYINNTAEHSGGANYFNSTVSDSDFSGTYINNTAENSGGANYFVGTVSDSYISGSYINNTASDGGANYFGNTVSNGNISGIYINNTAKFYGGANYFVGTVSDSYISGSYINNTASDGGANYFGNTVSNGNISGIYINNTAKFYGGANEFYRTVSDSDISGTYINNTAYYGGANEFYRTVSDSDISGTYINNTAYYGGANYFFNAVSNVNISGTYINNTADGSALIYFADSYNEGLNATISDAIFINNKCTDVIYAKTNGVVAYNNWFGNNATNYNEKPETRNVNMINWLFLNATADSSRIGVGNSSKIAFVLQSYNGTSDVGFYDASKMNVNLTLSQTLGELNKTSALIGEKILYTVKNVGNATVTGKFETVSYTLSLTSKSPTNITVANSTVDLKVGDVVDLGATLTPADAGNLTYTSGNTSVAIVENGKIKALANGTAVITVSFPGNENYTAAENKTINVTVNLKDAIISVNNSTLDLFVGDNFTVVATTTPAGLKVTFVQDDSGVYIVDENGNVTALKEGTGHILVKVGGDGVYAENTTEITVSVSKIPTEITLTNATLDLKVNEIVDGLANLTPADAGNLTFISSDENIVFVADGAILARGKGNATVTVSFAGNDKYAAALNRTIHVNVSLNDASVSVENDTLELKVDERYDLNATAVPSFLNVEYVSSNESVATVTDYGIVTAVGEGTTTITLTVGNDVTYAVNTTNVTVTVSKIPTEITVDTTPLDLFVGDEIVIVANLTPAGAGNVTFTSSDYDVVDFDFEDNVIAQGKGQAIITVSFAGDDKYAAAENKTIIINVSLDNASVTVDNNTLDLKVGETSAINATKHPDTIMLDITYTSSNNSVATVDKNGIVTAVGEGTAVITVEVGDDEIYAKNSTTVNVTVSKVSTEIESSAVTTVYNVDKNLIVTLKDANGNPIRGANITVDLNGEKTYTTDENGQVNVSTNGLKPVKIYPATITFAGDEKYLKSTARVNVEVKKATPRITSFNKVFKSTVTNKVYLVALKDNRGNAMKNTRVTLRVGGVTYSAITNAKGIAVFRLTKLTKVGLYNALARYAGNSYYNAVAKKTLVKVAFPTVSKGSKDKAMVKKIQIALKKNGYYLSAYGHYLKVDGIYHIHTENAVKQFQKAKGLKVTGKVDEKTAKKLKII